MCIRDRLVTIILNVVINVRHPTPLCCSSPTSTSQYSAEKKISTLKRPSRYPEVTTIDTFYTNDEGTLITPEKLEYGSGYSLVEVFAPYGYTLNSEGVYFDVTQDASTDEDGVTAVSYTHLENVRKRLLQRFQGIYLCQ